jgi:hypothetical protein
MFSKTKNEPVPGKLRNRDLAMNRAKHFSNKQAKRKGAMLPVVAFLLPVIIVVIGYSINIAYMELARTELRVTCDSAAKSALVNFGSTQNQTTAIAFGQSISAQNTVGGNTLTIPTGNFSFGNAAKNASNVYVFTAGGTPTNSVQVTGSATVGLPFGSMVSSGKYTCSEVSIAARVSHDVVLVLDRSASMAFDLSGSQFSYPADRADVSPLQSYFTAPSTTASRWSSLTAAVNSFISVLQARNLDVNVALVTYAETYSLGSYSATQASVDVQLTSNYTQIQTAMNNWGQTPLLGDTNIAAGLALAQGELTSSRARVTADRTIILMTDGVATTGNSNIASLTSGYRTGSSVVTYVITFGGEASSGTVQTSMSNAASNGNGKFYNAATSAQLTAAFQNIADSLPAVLIQ